MDAEYIEKTKKRWLLVTNIRYWIIPCAYLIIILIFGLVNNMGMMDFIKSEDCTDAVVSITVGLIWRFVLGHCSYKKTGTRWLVWVMICGTMGTLREAANSVKPTDGFSLEMTLTAVDIGFLIWWLILSKRLCKVNKHLRELTKLSLSEKTKTTEDAV